MSEEEGSGKTGYVGIRISQKQQKCRDGIAYVRKLQREMSQNKVIGIPTLKTMRGVKEVVSGLAMPRKNDE
jgi:hypothetical protein